MGNAKTLALIAKAAQKLPRVDPEYAARVKENRLRRHRVTTRVATREFERAFSKLLKTKGYNPDAFASDFSVESIQTQDNILSELEKSDFSLQSKPEFKTTVKEDRTARLYTFDGLTLTLNQWAERTGIPAGTLYHRLKVGYSVEDAFTCPNNGSESKRRRFRHVGPSIVKAKTRRQGGSLGRLYEYEGELLSLTQWSKLYGVNRQTLVWRLSNGMALGAALNFKAQNKLVSEQHISGEGVQTFENDLGTAGVGSLDSLPKQDFFQDAAE